MKLIFATNNQHKIEELQSAIGSAFELQTLRQAGIDIEIPEPYDTLEENAEEKARVIHELTGLSCFSEDTGLEVEILNGEPGVKSARYAAGDPEFADNIEKLLFRIGNRTPVKARFRTVIALILNNETHFFEGICQGHIINERRGSSGFGYDPVFVPEGDTRTFAEMSLDEKNLYSHRKKAAMELVLFLQHANEPAKK